MPLPRPAEDLLVSPEGEKLLRLRRRTAEQKLADPATPATEREAAETDLDRIRDLSEKRAHIRVDRAVSNALSRGGKAKDPGHFPEKLLYPEGPVGDVARWIAQTAIRSQPALALGASLAGFGALLGRRYRTPTNLRTTFFGVGIGPSGCGKDFPRIAIKTLFAQAGLSQMLGGERIASGPGLLAAMRRSPSCLFMLDEFGDLMQQVAKPGLNHAASILPVFKTLYSSSNTVYRGQEYAGQDDEHPRRDLLEPNPCIFGTTTPESFYESLSSRNVLDGYLGRFLCFAASDPRPTRHIPESTDPPSSLVATVKMIDAAADSGRGNLIGATTDGSTATAPKPATLSEAASRALDDLDAQVSVELETRSHRGTAALWQRAEENALRVALILAASENPHQPEIGEAHVEWAWKLVTWSVRHLEWACDTYVADTPFEADCKRVLALIRETGPDGMTLAGLTKSLWRMDKRRREEVLDTLVQSGAVHSEDVRSRTRTKTILTAAT